MIDVTEENGDVLFSYEGSLDLTGVTFFGSAPSFDSRAQLGADQGAIISFFGFRDTYDAPALAPFGASGLTQGFGVSGDSFAIFSGGSIGLAQGYQSGDFLSGVLTISNTTIKALELFAGVYTSTLASGDTITLTIPDTSDIPLPAAAPMLLAGLFGLGGLRRLKAARS